MGRGEGCPNGTCVVAPVVEERVSVAPSVGPVSSSLPVGRRVPPENHMTVVVVVVAPPSLPL